MRPKRASELRAARAQCAAGRDLAMMKAGRPGEADRNQEPAQRGVDRRQRLPDLFEILGAGAHDQLVRATGQNAAGLEQGLQRRQHLLERAMVQRKDLHALLGPSPRGAERSGGKAHPGGDRSAHRHFVSGLFEATSRLPRGLTANGFTFCTRSTTLL